jgi:hypothetical protein
MRRRYQQSACSIDIPHSFSSLVTVFCRALDPRLWTLDSPPITVSRLPVPVKQTGLCERHSVPYRSLGAHFLPAAPVYRQVEAGETTRNIQEGTLKRAPGQAGITLLVPRCFEWVAEETVLNKAPSRKDADTRRGTANAELGTLEADS